MSDDMGYCIDCGNWGECLCYHEEGYRDLVDLWRERCADLDAELAQLREEDTIVKFEQYTKGGG